MLGILKGGGVANVDNYRHLKRGVASVDNYRHLKLKRGVASVDNYRFTCIISHTLFGVLHGDPCYNCLQVVHLSYLSVKDSEGSVCRDVVTRHSIF